jgi:hypothetical protein
MLCFFQHKIVDGQYPPLLRSIISHVPVYPPLLPNIFRRPIGDFNQEEKIHLKISILHVNYFTGVSYYTIKYLKGKQMELENNKRKNKDTGNY